MSDKFQNKYRISSTRMKNWDYGSNATYFVTICTKNREHYFGEIENGMMQLSNIGNIAHQYWIDIPNHFPFVELDEFVVMPNHVHGIIIINKRDNADAIVKTNTIDIVDVAVNTGGIVETQNFASLPPPMPPATTPPPPNWQPNKFGPQSKNLASIIRGYKTGVKKYATMNSIDFAWQSRYHDHIIRNDESFRRISDYIINNPSKWTNDKFFIT